MSETNETSHLAAARGGDHDAFALLVEPYRREILVHCYRILGSFEDAEDALQETWLRAWRRLNTFEERAPLRAWLYKIATNAALDACARQSARRSLPMHTLPPGDPRDPLPAPSAEPLWLDPFPDALLPEAAAGPDALYDAHESVTFAFLAVLQHLPARQRAVLILRDILEWRASEAAEFLDLTVTAVNSALQRARTTMRAHAPRLHDATTAPPDEQTTTLLTRYVQAWETANASLLVSLLHEDAALTMPPLPFWLQGRSAIAEFLTANLFGGDAHGRFHLVSTRANGCPAFAVYQRDETGRYRLGALQVLTIVDARIVEMHDFLPTDDRLFARFGLPLIL